MIDADRPFRNQDPLDENVRTGAERSGVGTWDLDFSTRKLDWSNTTRTLFGVAPDTPVDYELFLSLLEPHDRDRTEAALKQSIDTGCNFDAQYRLPARRKVIGCAHSAPSSTAPMPLQRGSAAS